jgi:hypothetical protein
MIFFRSKILCTIYKLHKNLKYIWIIIRPTVLENILSYFYVITYIIFMYFQIYLNGESYVRNTFIKILNNIYTA